MTGVPWRRVVLVIAAVATGLAGLLVVLRTDGYPAIDATVARATRWFVDEAAGVVVLADGFSGRTLARLEVPGEPGFQRDFTGQDAGVGGEEEDVVEGQRLLNHPHENSFTQSGIIREGLWRSSLTPSRKADSVVPPCSKLSH